MKYEDDELIMELLQKYHDENKKNKNDYEKYLKQNSKSTTEYNKWVYENSTQGYRDMVDREVRNKKLKTIL